MPSGVKYGKWTEDNMAEALCAMRTGGIGLNEAAKKYSIPKATLKRHLDGKNRFAAESRKIVGSPSDIPIEIENKIEDRLLKLDPKLRSCLNAVDIRRLAFQVAEANGIPHRFNQEKKIAGKTWYYNFMKRHPNLARATILDKEKNEDNHEMESPEDRRLVEAQEDSSSVDSSPLANNPQASPNEQVEINKNVPENPPINVLTEDPKTQPVTSNEASSSSEILNRNCSIGEASIKSKLSECSSEPSLITAYYENLRNSDSENLQQYFNKSDVKSCENVDRIYEENFFTDEVSATSSSESTPSRKRPAGEFLPINAEIKRIGVEISEEHAQQLKNDIRRLSPILVSLRERTLGEISLTSDSGLFEEDVQPLRLELQTENSTAESSESLHLNGEIHCESSCPKIEASVQNTEKFEREASNPIGNEEKSTVLQPKESQSLEDPKDPKNAIIPDEETDRNTDETIQRPNTPSNVQRELVIVLSRVDLDGAEMNKSDQENPDPIVDCAVSVTESIDITSADTMGCEVSPNTSKTSEIEDQEVTEKSDESLADFVEKDDSVLLADFCSSPKYIGNDQLSRKSPKVVIERTLESSSKATTPESGINKGESLQRLNLDSVRKTLADGLLENADEDEIPIVQQDDPLRLESLDEAVEATSDLQESLDTETETETVSDTSELASMNSIRLGECAEPATSVSSCPETDSLPSDEVQTEIITRLERPEAFTEDSAESLALATGARDEVRSDGSDSGLGSEIPGDPGPAPAPESDSETSFLDRIPDEILTDKDKVVNPLEAFVPDAGTSGTQQPQQQQQQPIPLPNFPSPPKSSLKRRLTDCMEGEPSPKRINTEDPMRKKRNIQFDAVTVYYFPRAQGFTCVPSQGGSTLGMSANHTHAERFSLAEHATEQRRIHRARLAQLRSERAANCVTEAASSSEDPSDDTDEEPSDTEELDIDSYYFLQPVPTWQRRALLRAAGVRRIDAVEKDDCRDIRASREHCGCGCKGYCDPESCPCSRANVKCQVDRAGFPCGCSRDGCANSSGRIEFNPVRVRTHFIHTLMRLQLEKKQRDEDRTDHEQMLNNQSARGPMREVPSSLMVNPMDHPSVITGDPVSCINAGGFTTLHYENHETASTSCQPIVHAGREDSLDLYAIRDDCYSADPEAVGVDGLQNSQRKLHPEFGQAFQTFPGQQPSVSFPQGSYTDYQGYQNLPSTSRSQFQPQFQAIPSANASFSHYAYGQDPSVMQTPCQPHQGASHHVYENTFTQEDQTGTQQQYTNLNSVQPMNAVVQQMGKLEPFSELLAGRYSYYGEVDPQNLGNYQQHNGAKIEAEKSQPIVQQASENSTEDCDENFGEIIKKSMVETVSA